MDDLLREFLTETGENLERVDVELVRFEQEPNNIKILESIFRLVHTIKGTCGFLGLSRLQALTHAAESVMSGFRQGRPVTSAAVSLILATVDRIKALLEDLERHQSEPQGSDDDLIARLQEVTGSETSRPDVEPANAARERSCAAAAANAEPVDRAPAPVRAAASRDERRSGEAASSSIRVPVSTLDHLMTVVSELVLTRNQLIELVRRHQDSEFKAPLQRLSHVTAELQESVLKTRMQPIGNAWQKLPRIVRDLSTELDKAIELELHGAETELDRQVLEVIRDPLTHMVRNAADHGVESREQRRCAGKPELGTIRLSAWQEGGHILIEIRDDGRGLDLDRIAAKAVSLGLASHAELDRLTSAEIQRFIFASGFSTADSVTSVSGRGIGMDVVRANIEKIGGTVEVSSAGGSGTAFTVKIPLTLAIVSALIIELAENRFAIPQLAVVEVVRIRPGSQPCLEHIRDSAVLRLRDKLLPVIELRSLLGLGASQSQMQAGFIVVMQVGAQAFGLLVDGVHDTEEIVVKPMSSRLRDIAVFSGTTMLGDGSVILILDPNGIARTIGISQTARCCQPDAGGEPKQAQTESLLLFRAGSRSPKAVPLSLVTRLEEIDTRSVEIANGRPAIQYRGRLMPLVAAAEDMELEARAKAPVLVFSEAQRSMGLVVDEIVDIAEDRLEIELASANPGFIGSAIVKGQATEILDIGHFLPIAFPDWRRRQDRAAAGTELRTCA